MKITAATMLLAGTILFSCRPNTGTIYCNEEFTWYADSVRQGNYISYAKDSSSIFSEYPKSDGTTRTWKLKNDISRFGTFSGTSVFETALYNMALDELVNNIEKDSTLRTGALWSGVWTRDISYSIILSLAGIVPDESKKSLLCKVDDLDRIIQDTGTGGSWPCSTDRVVWALAAWKIYMATGDLEWLAYAYHITDKSLEDDKNVIFDKRTGLVRGESSFIDWREQSYPKWMQPADIYGSECLGTNALYYAVLKMMGKAAGILGYPNKAKQYAHSAGQLSEAINRHLWMEDKGYFAQFMYGRNYLLRSPRSETLGESLAILSGIADSRKSRRIISSMPISPFGPTIFWPQIEDMPNYHNNAVWPFVASFYAMAAASANNPDAFIHAMAGNIRAAAMFASNQENFSASDGSADTELNSPNMLWSIAGLLGIYRNILMGLDMQENGLAFSPYVPKNLEGSRRISGMKYRDMILDITVTGFGNGIRKFIIDGKKRNEAFIPADLIGKHSVIIELDGNISGNSKINMQPYTASPDTPSVSAEGMHLKWDKVPYTTSYKIFKNGKQIGETHNTEYELTSAGEYSVIAVGTNSHESFASEPIRIGLDSQNIPAEKMLYRFDGLEPLKVHIPATGIYSIEWTYSNGNGCVANKNMCATRSLFIDNKFAGTSVFPQRGDKDWNASGQSFPVHIELEAGDHEISLQFMPWNENMNIENNDVYIRALNMTRISDI